MKMKMSAVLTLSILLLSVSCVSVVSACNPVIVLSPDEGFSAFMVSGSDFETCKTITCYWDGVVVPVVGVQVTSSTGAFTVMMVVQDQGSPGVYNVTVVDSCGYAASANFTVLDMTGSQGEAGVQGLSLIHI